MNRKNNKGLSLVELIVAIAILAVVSIGILGFVAFSSRNYSSANKNVKLQYEQQMTVNRIRDIVLETSRGIAFDDTAHKLTVFSDTAGSSLADGTMDPAATPVILSQIYFAEPGADEDAGKLYLLTKTFAAADIEGKEFSSISISGTPSLLTDTVTAFDADLSNVGKGKVTLHITFKVGEKEVEVNPEIALRNMIDVIGNDTKLDELYNKEIIEFSSNVQKVEISRDGKVFGQAKTDTIAMAGDTTTVDYDAIVTKKSFYKGDIDTTVTWELEGVKAGHEQCISIDASSGKVTLKNAGGKTPSDYVEGDTFIVKAISNEDPTKIARLRVKVTGGGVYPESITFTETHKTDLVNAQVVYQFAHTITYTGLIKNGAGVESTTLSGNDVFTRISYKVYEEDKTTLATLPKNAGLSSTKTDGVFRAVKSMEDKVYWIKVAVLQKDKNGEEVAQWLKLEIGKIPDEPKQFTVPELFTIDEYRRADDNAASVQWTNGVPTHKAVNAAGNEVDMPYYYWYEWKLEPVEGWGSSARSKFDGNVYLKFGSNGANKGLTYTASQTESRMALIYVEPRVDWSKTFTMRVSVRAKLATSLDSKEKYYVLKSGTKIYPTDGTPNDPVYTLSSDTFISSYDWTWDKNNHRVFYNNQWYYADSDAILPSYATVNGGIALFKGNNYGAEIKGRVWHMDNVHVKVLDIAPGTTYPYYVTLYNSYYNASYTGWTGTGNDLSSGAGGINTSWNGFRGYYTNAEIKLYNSPVYGSSSINSAIHTANGTEEVKILDASSNDRVKVSFKRGNETIVGYTNGNRWNTIVEKERDVEAKTYYYKLPTDENNLDDILTEERSEAYVSSKVVTINPVKLTLEPVETTLYLNDQVAQGKLTAYTDTYNTVYLGKGVYGKIDWYNASEAYKYYDVQDKTDGKYGYKLDESRNGRPYYYEYYKCFIPTFTGIRVDTNNYSSVIGGVRKNLGDITALQPYAYETVGGEKIVKPQSLDGNWFDSRFFMNVDNNLYVYVKMIPYYWSQRFDPFPSGVRWACVIEEKEYPNDNYVIANSVNGEYYYFDYSAKYELNP